MNVLQTEPKIVEFDYGAGPVAQDGLSVRIAPEHLGGIATELAKHLGRVAAAYPVLQMGNGEQIVLATEADRENVPGVVAYLKEYFESPLNLVAIGSRVDADALLAVGDLAEFAADTAALKYNQISYPVNEVGLGVEWLSFYRGLTLAKKLLEATITPEESSGIVVTQPNDFEALASAMLDFGRIVPDIELESGVALEYLITSLRQTARNLRDLQKSGDGLDEGIASVLEIDRLNRQFDLPPYMDRPDEH